MDSIWSLLSADNFTGYEHFLETWSKQITSLESYCLCMHHMFVDQMTELLGPSFRALVSISYVLQVQIESQTSQSTKLVFIRSWMMHVFIQTFSAFIVFCVLWELTSPRWHTYKVKMNNKIGQHNTEPFRIFSMMSYVCLQWLLIQSRIQFSPRSWSINSYWFLKECIVLMRQKKSISASLSIHQDKTHRNIDLKALLIVHISNEI